MVISRQSLLFSGHGVNTALALLGWVGLGALPSRHRGARIFFFSSLGFGRKKKKKNRYLLVELVPLASATRGIDFYAEHIYTWSI